MQTTAERIFQLFPTQRAFAINLDNGNNFFVHMFTSLTGAFPVTEANVSHFRNT
jgi:hypothetical protein